MTSWNRAVCKSRHLCAVVAPLRGGDAGRLVTGVWLLVSLILATVYRSNLKAMLILPKLELPFNSLEELVNTDLPVWVKKGSHNYNAILTAENTTALAKLKHQMYHLGGYQAIKGFEDGEHALAVPKSALEYFLHTSFSRKGKCTLYAMAEGFLKTTTLSLIFPKGSPLKQQIDPIIIRLRESGILDHLYRKTISNATECLKDVRNKPSQNSRVLVLGDFMGIFLVYTAGILIAIMVFLVEVLLHIAK